MLSKSHVTFEKGKHLRTHLVTHSRKTRFGVFLVSKGSHGWMVLGVAIEENAVVVAAMIVVSVAATATAWVVLGLLNLRVSKQKLRW